MDLRKLIRNQSGEKYMFVMTFLSISIYARENLWQYFFTATLLKNNVCYLKAKYHINLERLLNLLCYIITYEFHKGVYSSVIISFIHTGELIFKMKIWYVNGFYKYKMHPYRNELPIKQLLFQFWKILV